MAFLQAADKSTKQAGSSGKKMVKRAAAVAEPSGNGEESGMKESKKRKITQEAAASAAAEAAAAKNPTHLGRWAMNRDWHHCPLHHQANLEHEAEHASIKWRDSPMY